MAASPIHLPATFTTTILGTPFTYPRRYLLLCLLPLRALRPQFMQYAVTGSTAAKGPNLFKKIKPRHDLPYLLKGSSVLHIQPAQHYLAHQQLTVPGQQDKLLVRRALRQIGITGMVMVFGIETQNSKAAGQSSQMHIRYKARVPQGFRPQMGESADVKTLKHRVDRYFVARLHLVGKIDRRTVY